MEDPSTGPTTHPRYCREAGLGPSGNRNTGQAPTAQRTTETGATVSSAVRCDDPDPHEFDCGPNTALPTHRPIPAVPQGSS